MGGDGGSIPGRADVVRTAGYKFARNLGGMGYLPNSQVRAGSDKLSTSEEKHVRWTRCALTQEPLQPPLSVCRLGQLYNREALIHRLLHRKSVPLQPNFAHIESRKDVKDLNIEFEENTGRIICPITKLEFDGRAKGVVLWSCGCVISTKALKTLTAATTSQQSSSNAAATAAATAATAAATPTAADSHKEKSDVSTVCAQSNNVMHCPVCNAPYNASTDVVQLIPDLEEIPDLKAKLASLKGKKEKKSEKKTTQGNSSAADACTDNNNQTLPHLKKGDDVKEIKISDSQNNLSSSPSSKRPRSELVSAAGPSQSGKEMASKKVKLAEDLHNQRSEASSVYKSIFKVAQQ